MYVFKTIDFYEVKIPITIFDNINYNNYYNVYVSAKC